MFKYNSQRDNYEFAGKFRGWAQCFSTCAFMFLSYWIDKIDGSDDNLLRKYVDDVEQKVGNKGTGEEIAKQHNIKGYSSLYWVVQKAGIEKWLEKHGINRKMVYYESDGDLDELIEVTKRNEPVIVGTSEIGGLGNGHIILLFGYCHLNDHNTLGFMDDKEYFFVNDPYGNAMKDYKDHDGENLLYPIEYVYKHARQCGGLRKDKIRFMYLGK